MSYAYLVRYVNDTEEIIPLHENEIKAFFESKGLTPQEIADMKRYWMGGFFHSFSCPREEVKKEGLEDLLLAHYQIKKYGKKK